MPHTSASLRFREVEHAHLRSRRVATIESMRTSEAAVVPAAVFMCSDRAHPDLRICSLVHIYTVTTSIRFGWL